MNILGCLLPKLLQGAIHARVQTWVHPYAIDSNIVLVGRLGWLLQSLQGCGRQTAITSLVCLAMHILVLVESVCCGEIGSQCAQWFVSPEELFVILHRHS